jgi:hypothetical protein
LNRLVDALQPAQRGNVAAVELEYFAVHLAGAVEVAELLLVQARQAQLRRGNLLGVVQPEHLAS